MIEPQPGDFGLVPIKGDIGRLIRFGQWCNGEGFANYEHAFLYLDNSQIIEAEPGPNGARIVDLTYTNVLWSSGAIKLTQEERVNIVAAGRSFEGVPYSVMDYFSLAALRLDMDPVIPGLRHYVETSKHMICSQLVDKAYQVAGVEIFKDKRWNGNVTPASLENFILHPALFS